MNNFRSIHIAETAGAAGGVVDDLIRHGDGARTHVRTNAADRIDAHDAARAGVVQRPYIRAIVDAVRREPMTEAQVHRASVLIGVIFGAVLANVDWFGWLLLR